MFKKIKKISYLLILLSISIFLLPSSILFSQNKINSVNVNPLNRIRISFDKLPTNYISELSDDKKTITINLNEPFQQLDTIINFQGIISKATVNSSTEKCSIVLTLNDKRGYTIATLPYSNSLLIDVFQWNTLTIGEDKFRTALIALESNFKENAFNDLIESIKENTKDAAVILGLELLEESYIESSKLLFDYALYKNDTAIYELYAGLSDVYNQKAETDKSNRFSALYLKTANTNKLNFILSSFKNPNDSNFMNKIKFLDSILKQNTTADSINTTIVDSTNVSKQKTNSLKDDNINSNIVEYAVYLMLGLLVLIIYFYAKWRNKKIQDLIELKKIKVPEKKPEKAQKKPNIGSKLANVYKKQDAKVETTMPTKIEKSEAQKITEQNDKAQSLLEIVKKVQDENKNKESVEKNISDLIEKKQRTQIPAKVEIAMNIANEQKKIKEQSLEEFNAISLPSESDKLFEISKKLGIEMGGFEIRKQIEKIMKSDKEIEDLKNKFTNRIE